MNTFIITAGGIGRRMGSKIPKQFIEIGDQPILMHTLNVFYNYDSSAQIILTLPRDWWGYWKELCLKHEFNVEFELVEGGKERFDSIKNALKHTKGEIVGVHDGVRPFVSYLTIDQCVKTAINEGSAVPVLPAKESVRQGGYAKSKALNRSEVFMVQTPQCFQLSILNQAYKAPFSNSFTDDASVVEKFGHKITLVNGNEENIKITTPQDLRIAQAFL
jgi:2-C-methyl-D-erythritol 4-phosphate cytidylyltransferase